MLFLLLALFIPCVWVIYGGVTMRIIQDKCDDLRLSQTIGFAVWFFFMWLPVILTVHLLGVFN